MEGESPLITIIIPSFNQGPYIEKSILSIRNQTFQNWELLIQDGGSSDQTAEVCKKHVSEDPRIRFISEPDTGFADAVNKALDVARGQLVSIQSSDDFFSNANVFSEVQDIYKKYPQLIIISAYNVNVDKDLNQVLTPPPSGNSDNGFLDRHKIFSLNNFFPQSATFFSRSRALHIGKLRIEHDIVADTDFWERIANYKPTLNDAIYRSESIWGCVTLHEEQRSVHPHLFAFGTARMFASFLNDDRMDIAMEEKQRLFKLFLYRALDYYLYEQKDITEIKALYKENTNKSLPFRLMIKHRISRIKAFRNYLFRSYQQLGSIYMLSFPRGESYNWFNKTKNQ